MGIGEKMKIKICRNCGNLYANRRRCPVCDTANILEYEVRMISNLVDRPNRVRRKQ